MLLNDPWVEKDKGNGEMLRTEPQEETRKPLRNTAK